MKRAWIKRKRVSTNSRPWENLELRQAYREDHQLCELFQPLKDIDQMLPMSIKKRNSMNGTDTHHIFHGGKQRWDFNSNLIQLCRPIHDLDVGYGGDLLIACLITKWRKSLVDPREFNLHEWKLAAGNTEEQIERGANKALHEIEMAVCVYPKINDWRLALIEEIQRRI